MKGPCMLHVWEWWLCCQPLKSLKLLSSGASVPCWCSTVPVAECWGVGASVLMMHGTSHDKR